MNYREAIFGVATVLIGSFAVLRYIERDMLGAGLGAGMWLLFATLFVRSIWAKQPISRIVLETGLAAIVGLIGLGVYVAIRMWQ